jgi:hypothetical protein
MFFRQLAVLGLLMATAACGLPETVRLADSPDASLAGKELHSTREAPPSFIAMTATHGAFAMVGVAAAIAEGNTLVAQAGIENPAAGIEDAITSHLRSRYGTAGSGRPLSFDDDKPGDLAAWARENNVRDLIVDVETNGWGFNHMGFNYSSYAVSYSAVFRLIESSSGQVLAQHTCTGGSPDDAEGAPSHDDLLANDAALIKSLLDERAQACIAEITTQVL